MTNAHHTNIAPSILSASKAYPCPQCGKTATWQNNPAKPFCSPRCKLIDLGAWASEDYKISATDAPFSDELDPYQS